MSMFKRILGTEKKEDKEKRIWKGDDTKTQFKALVSFYRDISLEERKAWNREDKNQRKVFGLCRSALEEYSRGPGHGKPPNWSDTKRPVELIICLRYLCEDNPDVIASKRNLHAWTDLCRQFLDNRTNPTIRVEGLKLLHTIIDGTRERCPREYLLLLRHSPDFTPFCEKGRYDRYSRNFKSDMIVATDPLPWTRHGKATKGHCLFMLKELMELSFDSSDFDFWYAYFVEHIYPQLYYRIPFEKHALVDGEFGPDSRNEYKTSDIELYGFGSASPPDKLQRLIADFMVRVLSDKRGYLCAASSELRIRYLLEILRRTTELPLENWDVYFKLFRYFEHWLFGINLPPEFAQNSQEYWSMIFSDILARVLEEVNVGHTHLKAKVRINGYVTYLYRIAICEPHIDWTPATWRSLCKSLMNGMKRAFLSDCKNSELIFHCIYPLCYVYLKCLTHVMIRQPSVANEMLESFATEISTWLTFRPFVVVWREYVRNLTLSLLEMLKRENEELMRKSLGSSDDSSDDDNDAEGDPTTTSAAAVTEATKKKISGKKPSSEIPGSPSSVADSEMDDEKHNGDLHRECKYRADLTTSSRRTHIPMALREESWANFGEETFNVDARMHQLRETGIGEVIEFRNSAQAFLIWDRFLHLIGNPNHNRNDHTREVHLEGVTDSLKIIVAALNLLPISAAKLLKEQLAAKKRAALAMRAAAASVAGDMKEDHDSTTASSSSSSSSTSSMSMKSGDGDDSGSHSGGGGGSKVQEYGLTFSKIGIELSNMKFINEIGDASIRQTFPLPPRQVLPQGDTLSYIYCPYLFDTCFDVIRGKIGSQISRSQEFETAFSGLCYVLLTRTCAEFEPNVLSHFYDIIKSSFDSSKVSQKIRAVVVRCCAEHCLFGSDKMTGVNILLPDFMSLVCIKFGLDDSTAATSTVRTDVQIDREVCNEEESIKLLEICNTLVCFSSHFSSLSVKPSHGSGSSSSPSKSRASIVRTGMPMTMIKNIVLTALIAVTKITDARKEAIQLSVWGITTLIFDEVTSTRNPDFIKAAMRSLVQCCSIRMLNFASYAARSIEMLSQISDELIRIDEETVRNNLLIPFILNLQDIIHHCTSTEAIISRHKAVANTASDMIFSIVEWVFKFPASFLRDRGLMSGIFKGLLELIQITDVSLSVDMIARNFTSNLVFSAKSAMLILFNYLCNFPILHDTGAIHTNAKEKNTSSYAGASSISSIGGGGGGSGKMSVESPSSTSFSGSDEDLLQSHLFAVYQNSCLFSCRDQVIPHFNEVSHGVRLISRDDSVVTDSSSLSLSSHSARSSGKGGKVPDPSGLNSSVSEPRSHGRSESDGTGVRKGSQHSKADSDSMIGLGSGMTIRRTYALSTVREPSDPHSAARATPVGDVTAEDIVKIQDSAIQRVSSLVQPHISDNILSKPEFSVGFDNDDSLASVLNWMEDHLGGISATPEPEFPEESDPSELGPVSSSSKKGSKKKSPSPRGRVMKKQLKRGMVDRNGLLSADQAQSLQRDLDLYSECETDLRSHVDATRMKQAMIAQQYSEDGGQSGVFSMGTGRRPKSPTIQMITSRTSPTSSLSHSGGHEPVAGVRSSPSVEAHPLAEFEEAMKKRAFTAFDASRAFLSQLGLFTPGSVMTLDQGDSSLSSFKALQAAGIPIFEYQRRLRHRGAGVKHGDGKASGDLGLADISAAAMGTGGIRGGGVTGGAGGTTRSSARTTRGRGGGRDSGKFGVGSAMSLTDGSKHRTRSDAAPDKVSVLSFHKLASYYSMMDKCKISVLQGKFAALDRRIVPLDDSSMPREKHKIGLVYVCREQEDQKAIFKNTGGSPAYEKFANDLGTLVDLSMHEGFKGGLGSDTTGRFASYFGSITYEMIFHMPTRMPTRLEDPQQTEKKRHVGNDHVNIFWSEHYREYLTETISTSFNQVCIVIYPLPSGLYHIRVHRKAGVPYFGPLMDHMLVRPAILPSLVRMTVLEANRAVRYATPGYTKPFVERRKYIDEALGKLFSNDSFTMLRTFFPAIPVD